MRPDKPPLSTTGGKFDYRGATIVTEDKQNGWIWMVTYEASMFPEDAGYVPGRPNLLMGYSGSETLAVEHAKAAVDRISMETRQPPAPGYYYQRAELDDPWDVLQVTSEGDVLALSGERYAGTAAVEFMSEGEWLAIPMPPGGELAE